jgi:hypothetical protein
VRYGIPIPDTSEYNIPVSHTPRQRDILLGAKLFAEVRALDFDRSLPQFCRINLSHRNHNFSLHRDLKLSPLMFNRGNPNQLFSNDNSPSRPRSHSDSDLSHSSGSVQRAGQPRGSSLEPAPRFRRVTTSFGSVLATEFRPGVDILSPPPARRRPLRRLPRSPSPPPFPYLRVPRNELSLLCADILFPCYVFEDLLW